MEILCAKCQHNPAPMTTFGPVWCDECNGKKNFTGVKGRDPRDTRADDWAVIEKGLRSKDPTERQQARDAREKLRLERQDRWTSSARSALLRETLAGNKQNAWDIRDEMVKHRGGRQYGRQNRGEKTSFFF